MNWVEYLGKEYTILTNLPVRKKELCRQKVYSIASRNKTKQKHTHTIKYSQSTDSAELQNYIEVLL